ncbi:hypothetical protein EJ110_NYTH33828 [Nymphaea thermarum]|nr:hypothetical protein EJ110_NYTH33828 [Nymphaea thermarum]
MVQSGMDHFYHIFYEGCLTNFEIGEDGAEASKLYPEVVYTRWQAALFHQAQFLVILINKAMEAVVHAARLLKKRPEQLDFYREVINDFVEASGTHINVETT